MIRKITFGIALSAIVLFAFQNANGQNGKMSPMTKLLVKELNRSGYAEMRSGHLPKKFSKDYLIKQQQGDYFIGGLIKVNSQLNQQDLSAIGGIVGTKAGKIWTLRIPLANIEKLKEIKGIDYIQIDEPLREKLDSAMKYAKVTLVYDGTNNSLPQNYFGKNVVVGVIDFGFDYTHPMLYDTNGNLRIKRVWEQTTTGTPPSGFSYGHEATTPVDIISLNESGGGSHGSHTAGISGGTYGVAQQSDLVLVMPDMPQLELIETGNSNVIDAINYIFTYANSQSKPAVINMSLGTHLGPHNGTSLFDEACDALVGNGKILVGASGNEGGTALHIKHTFSGANNEFYTFPDPEASQSSPWSGMVDIWGQQGKDFCIQAGLYDVANTSIFTSTGSFCASAMTDTSIILTGSDGNTCELAIATDSSQFNNQPRAFIYIMNQSSSDFPFIHLQGTSGTIHLWNHGTGTGSSFTGVPSFLSPAKSGDTLSTMGEIGGTGKNIISVGAYTTKRTYTNIDGNLETIPFNVTKGKIAPFSSVGPTTDGRTKPDITAPGNVVISSVNSFDPEYQRGGQNFNHVFDSITDGTNVWYFAAMQGTSMATPMVTGIIALWLEANPVLNPTMIKQYLQNNSTADTYTGTVPNNTWGWGKIDAYKAMRSITSIVEKKGITKDIHVYPNPAEGVFTLYLNDADANEIKVYDINGKLLFTEKIEAHYSSFVKNYDLSYLPDGLYLLQVKNSKETGHFKLSIQR